MNITVQSIRFNADQKLIEFIKKKTGKLDFNFKMYEGQDRATTIEGDSREAGKPLSFVYGLLLLYSHFNKSIHFFCHFKINAYLCGRIQ